MHATLRYDAPGERLTCECHGVPLGTSLTYRLMRHGALIDRSTVTSATSHSWDLTRVDDAGGDFHVTVQVGDDADKVIRTEWQYVPSRQDRSEFAEWLKSDSRAVDVPLPELNPRPRPFESIAYLHLTSGLVPSESLVSRLGELVDRLGAVVHHIDAVRPDGAVPTRDAPEIDLSGGSFLLASSEPLGLPGGVTVFGSGYAYDGALLRRGSEVGHALLRTPEPAGDSASGAFSAYSSHRCGDFHAAVVRRDGAVEFHTDYVGGAAWFEFRSKDLTIVATSFLLAVSLAQACGVELALNYATIDADFTSLTQPFQQPILDELELAGFSCVRPDTVLSYALSGVRHVDRSTLGMDLDAPPRFTVQRYGELLDQAAAEIRANCAAIIDDPLTEQIRCDITGGLDSRLVLAGFLAASPAAADKVTLYTEGSRNAPLTSDAQVAIQIAEATGLKFSGSGDVSIGPCAGRHVIQKQISATFGVYWHRRHGHSRKWDERVVYAGGGGLGNIARDYTTDGWQLVSESVAAAEEVSLGLARQIFKWRGRATMKAAPHEGITRVAKSWDEIPGDVPDKGSNLFNFFRARFHGGNADAIELGMFRVAPGPSRPLYQLRLMAGRLLSGPQVQLELIDRLSPELASIPYANQEYNETYLSLFGSQRTGIGSDRRALDEARELRQRSARWEACPQCANVGVRDRGAEESAHDLAVRALREMARSDPRLAELLLPAYRFARDHLGTTYPLQHSYSRTFVNKLLHLHGMWQMGQGVRLE